CAAGVRRDSLVAHAASFAGHHGRPRVRLGSHHAQGAVLLRVRYVRFYGVLDRRTLCAGKNDVGSGHSEAGSGGAMKNLDSVFAAYIIGWGVFFLYYVSIAKRTADLRAEVERLKNALPCGK